MSVMQNGELQNIPSARMRQLGNRLKDIHIQMIKLQEEANKIREEATEHLGLGSYETMSVYKVSACDVTGYHRRGYKAVRVRTGLSRKAALQKS
jgi:hypothetical protein